jgi:hypothetical protein
MEGVGVIIAAIAMPFILLIVMISSLASGTADHNNAAVRLSFHGGVISDKVPENYRQYIQDIRAALHHWMLPSRKSHRKLRAGASTQCRSAIFYSLYFGAPTLSAG